MRNGIIILIAIQLFGCTQKPECEGESNGLPAEALVIALEQDDLDVFNIEGYRDSLLIDADNIPKRIYESGCIFWKSSYYKGQDKKAHLIIIPQFENEQNEFTKALSTLSPSSKTDKFSIYKDVWAKPQMIVQFKYKEDLKSWWIENSKEVLDSLVNYETRLGLRGFYKPTEITTAYSNLIESKVGARFQIPSQFEAHQTDSSLAWFTQSTNTFYQHVLVSSLTKSDMPKSLSIAESQRELFINSHIKNDEGSKIIVSNSQYFKKSLDTVQIEGKSVLRFSGWYAEEGTFRRGIFYRYYFLKGDKVTVLDAFAFAPNLPKSRFARLFQTIANTYRD